MNKKTVVWGVFILVAILVFFVFTRGVTKTIQSYESSIVTSVCKRYYTNAAPSRKDHVNVVGVFDSDNNGYGSCGVYDKETGARLDSLECDAAWFWNTDACRAQKFGFTGN